MCLLSDWQIRTILCVSGLSRNLFFIIQSIPTGVGKTLKGHGCRCRTYDQFIAMDFCRGTKNFYGGGGKTEYEVRGGGRY